MQGHQYRDILVKAVEGNNRWYSANIYWLLGTYVYDISSVLTSDAGGCCQQQLQGGTTCDCDGGGEAQKIVNEQQYRHQKMEVNLGEEQYVFRYSQ